MDIQQLTTFTTIVQQGSFSKASVKLGYSQAAVTIQIKKLEEELHIKLFDRLGKTISLTQNGRLFYRHTLTILDDIKKAKESVTNNELQGQLTIGCIDSLCTSVLLDLLKQYRQKYPQVSINILTDTITGLLDAIKNNEVDFAFLVDQSINDYDLVKVIEEPIHAYFVASQNHPLASKENISLETLKHAQLILTEKHASYRMLLESTIHESLTPVIECKNTDLILQLVKENQGITFLPHYLLEKDIQNNQLTKLSTSYDITLYKQVLHHKDKWISREMQAFFELL